MSVQTRGLSGNIADVDVNNQQLIRASANPAQAGAMVLYDPTGNAYSLTEQGGLLTSQDTLLLYEQVDGAALNTNVWTYSLANMTLAQAAGFISLNSGNITTVSSYAILNSIKALPLYGDLPLKITINARVPMQPEANAVVELGIGTASGTSVPTDGCFFRWGTAGDFRAVINYGGSETQSAPLTAPASNMMTLFQIVVVENHVQFFINDVLVADVTVPNAQAYPTNAGRQTVFARVYTSGVQPSIAPRLDIGQVIVAQQDMVQNKLWEDVLAGMGRGAYQSPVSAFGQTANHANSSAPASAVLSNTAAGYTTLGGKFQFAAVGGAATDYALFAFQVPANYQLFVKEVAISTGVTGAAIVTATILDWAIGVNASAVSLATVDGPGTWAPRRVPLGMQGFIALAGIGAMANDVRRQFDVPLVVDGGRYLHIILQIPSGAATGSLVFRGTLTVNGYFE